MNIDSLRETWNGWSKKKKTIVVIVALLVIGGFSSKNEKGAGLQNQSQVSSVSQGNASQTPPAQEANAVAAQEWRSSEGLNEAQWIARCQRYEAARQACAVADKPGQCMEIKLGVIDQANGDTYCENGKPNFFLMGRR